MMTVVTGMASELGQGTETDKKVLTVGLFRYVPDIKAFISWRIRLRFERTA